MEGIFFANFGPSDNIYSSFSCFNEIYEINKLNKVSFTYYVMKKGGGRRRDRRFVTLHRGVVYLRNAKKTFIPSPSPLSALCNK